MYSFFRSFVTIPFLNRDPKALNVVQYILESCLLRREKNMRDKDGRLVVDLPPKTVDMQVLDFSRAERQIYKHLEERARRRFIELDADGKAMSSYTSILAMLMKLRQCVDHPLLVMSKTATEDDDGDKLLEGRAGETSVKELLADYAGQREGSSDDAYVQQVLKELGENESPECVICYNEVQDEVLLPCFHRGCQDCIVDYIGHCEDQGKEASCPTCGKGPVKATQLRSVQRRRKRVHAFAEPASQDETVTIGKVDLVQSTKLRALVRKLAQLREEDPTFKALVFSQFTSFLGKLRHLQIQTDDRPHRADVESRGRALAALRWEHEPGAACGDGRAVRRTLFGADRASHLTQSRRGWSQPDHGEP